MRAVVVLGSNLHSTCRRLVAEAERVARAAPVELVVFSGWAPDGGESEAALMARLWHGPEGAELLLEETASSTAENASRTLPLLLERGVTDAVVVCAPLHRVRAGWMFRRIYGAGGVAVRFRVARVPPTPGAFLWEVGALTVAARQMRQARTEERRS